MKLIIDVSAAGPTAAGKIQVYVAR